MHNLQADATSNSINNSAIYPQFSHVNSRVGKRQGCIFRCTVNQSWQSTAWCNYKRRAWYLNQTSCRRLHKHLQSHHHYITDDLLFVCTVQALQWSGDARPFAFTRFRLASDYLLPHQSISSLCQAFQQHSLPHLRTKGSSEGPAWLTKSRPHIITSYICYQIEWDWCSISSQIASVMVLLQGLTPTGRRDENRILAHQTQICFWGILGNSSISYWIFCQIISFLVHSFLLGLDCCKRWRRHWVVGYPYVFDENKKKNFCNKKEDSKNCDQ